MKKKLLLIICIIILVSIFGPTTALAEDRSDPPAGYVVTDGTTYFWIDFNELFISYLSYRLDPNSDEGKLAKFYFDTLGDDVMSNMAAYVSGVTTKFVSYNGIFMMYLTTRDVDATYIWFNSSDPADATPAFGVKTEVKVMGSDGTVAGSVCVGADGYITECGSNSGIIIPGIARLNIDANTTDVYLNLGNPAENSCYFVISLVLEGGTVLYESDMLLPGETVGNAVLTQPLATGMYNASVRYEAFALDDMSPLNNAEVMITLIAQ